MTVVKVSIVDCFIIAGMAVVPFSFAERGLL
jgi:hypothetical protein